MKITINKKSWVSRLRIFTCKNKSDFYRVNFILYSAAPSTFARVTKSE